MHDILGLVAQIKRPRLLIHAARFGLEDYRRDSSLSRLLGYGSVPRTGVALIRLIEIEADIDRNRRRSEAGYSVSHHVEVLSAIMAEARLLRRATEANENGRPDPDRPQLSSVQAGIT